MPNRVSGPPTTSVTGTPAASTSYTIRPGDTLSKIAQATGTTVDQLVNLNKARYPSLETNRGSIQVGWQLTLPGGTRPPAGGTSPAAPEWAPRTNDQVMFVAINNSDAHKSTFESDQLRNRGVNIKVVQDAATPDQIAAGGRTHDLSTAEGRMSFALTLGLPAEQTQKIADAIAEGGPDIKDEMAQIAQMWAVAEKGGQVPSRLVFSGHHVGYGVYGENNGSLDWPLVKKLADAMPRGARSVQDLMIAGCYSGGLNMMEQYQSMFPNVKTIVAYSGSSPGAYSGATAHQKKWEAVTRGDSEGIRRNMFDGMRKGENVTVWTKTHGFDDGRPPASLSELRDNMQGGRAAYEAALAGRGEVGDPQTGPTRQFYNHLQRLIQHPELPATERRELESLRDQTIRLIFYPVVAGHFATQHGNRVSAGFQALGLQAPNFRTMSRPEALAAIAQFEQKLGSTSPVPAAARDIQQLMAGFKDLRNNVIPDTWV